MRKTTDISNRTLLVLVVLVIVTTLLSTWTALQLAVPASQVHPRATSGAVVLEVLPAEIPPTAPASTTGASP